jgi:hypothetical protein
MGQYEVRGQTPRIDRAYAFRRFDQIRARLDCYPQMREAFLSALRYHPVEISAASPGTGRRRSTSTVRLLIFGGDARCPCETGRVGFGHRALPHLSIRRADCW